MIAVFLATMFVSTELIVIGSKILTENISSKFKYFTASDGAYMLGSFFFGVLLLWSGICLL